MEKRTATFERKVECEVEYWFDDNSDLSYGDLAEIQSKIDEGYVEGELVFEPRDGEIIRGYWKLVQ